MIKNIRYQLEHWDVQNYNNSNGLTCRKNNDVEVFWFEVNNKMIKVEGH